MSENTTVPKNTQADPNKVETIDLLLVAAILLECAFLYICLITKQSFLGYFLPSVISAVAVVITGLSIRDMLFRGKIG